jgi:hypothetical protein
MSKPKFIRWYWNGRNVQLINYLYLGQNYRAWSITDTCGLALMGLLLAAQSLGSLHFFNVCGSAVAAVGLKFW